MNDYDYAIVVGINDYPEFGPLQGPVDDAKKFCDWLTSEDRGGGMPSNNCKTVLSTTSPPTPIQQQIDEKFGEIWRQLRENGNRGRRFYFYFGGHGVGKELNLTALLMANFSESFWRNSAISSEGYLRRIAESGKFEEIIFFLDCCRNKVNGVNGNEPLFAWPADNQAAGQVNSLIAYATTYKDYAYEAEVEDIPGAANYMGHFTKALLKGLWGEAAETTSGVITLDSLIKYLDIETPRIASVSNHFQKPRFNNQFSPNRLTTFGQPLITEVHYKIMLSPERTGKIRLVNGSGVEIKTGSYDSSPWEIDLKLDKYLLIQNTPYEILPINVRPSNEQVEIEF